MSSATQPLPERPSLEQLRKQARELQRSAGPDVRLSTAQRELARRYGFPSWPRLAAHVSAISERTWTWTPATAAGSAVENFLRAACLGYADGSTLDLAAARAVLAERPDLPSTDLAVAAVCGDVASVRDLLTGTPEVDAPTGPYGWTPLMYTAYGRLGSGDPVATVELLLAAGADPNEGRYFQGYPTPFTVLTGVFGDGEGDQPVHPDADALARALLAAGADPNDGQTLYNRMFSADDGFLSVLFEFGLGRGDGGPWRRRLPDLTPAPDVMVRQLLAWAVVHDQRERVVLLARHGVDVVAPLPAGPGPFVADGTPIATALRNGHRELADRLRALGADEPELDPVSTLVGAILAGDLDAVRAASSRDLAAARAARPGLVVGAATQGVAAVEAALAAGFDIDALARADVPIEQPWQTALHTAVERDDRALVARLLALGADRTVRDARFDGTALDWARHLGRPEAQRLLAEGSEGDAAG